MTETAEITRTFDLVRRAQSGDRQALGNLVARYYERVHAVVRVRLGPRLRGLLESGDILQDTFITALDRFDRFEMRDEGSLIHWLGKLAQHKITDAAEFHAAARRDPGRREPLWADGPVAEPADRGATPAEGAAATEENELLEACIHELPADYRELILLRNYAGCTWRAVARESGRPSAGAARMMHAKAMVALGKLVHDKKGR